MPPTASPLRVPSPRGKSHGRAIGPPTPTLAWPPRGPVRPSPGRLVLDALSLLPVVATVAGLVAELATTPAELAPTLRGLERRGLVDVWADDSGPRVMLAEAAARALGLELSPAADRWVRAGARR